MQNGFDGPAVVDGARESVKRCVVSDGRRGEALKLQDWTMTRRTLTD